MDMRIEIDRNTCEVCLTGDLRFRDHRIFRSLLAQCSAASCRTWVFNLSELTAIDSAGLGMLILAGEAAKRQGCTLVVRQAQGRVKTLIEIARLDQIARIEGAAAPAAKAPSASAQSLRRKTA